DLVREAIAIESDQVGRSHLLVGLHGQAGYYLVQLGDHAAAERHLTEAARLIAEQEPGAQYTGEEEVRGNWALAQLHYARGEIEQARAVAEGALDDDYGASLALLARIALSEGDAAAAGGY